MCVCLCGTPGGRGAGPLGVAVSGAQQPWGGALGEGSLPALCTRQRGYIAPQGQKTLQVPTGQKHFVMWGVALP